MDSGWHSELSVVFVLGGPGSGKGTHCKKLAESHQMEHLSIGDVLRSEIDNPNGKYGHVIRQNMEEGRVGPMEITVELLEKAIKAAYNTKGTRAFLLDGFPRKMDQALLFEKQICSPSLVLYLQCPEAIMESRLLARSATSGRFDDSQETIRKRLQTFNSTSLGVIRHYMEQGKVTEVDSTRELIEVYLSMEKGLKEGHLIPEPGA